MLRIDTATNAAALPDTPALGTPGYFTDGDPANGIPATRPGAYWFNMIQEEIMSVLTAAGITPDKDSFTNLREAIQVLAGFPAGTRIISGLKMTWTSASTITIGTGVYIDGSDVIIVETPIVLDLSTSGLNGLDTGVEANDTWYNAYLVKDSDTGTVGGVLSTVNEKVSGSITMPAGYDIKMQLPVPIRNSASGDILQFRTGAGYPYQPEVIYEVNNSYKTVLNTGTAGTYTKVDCDDLVPPNARQVILESSINTATSTFYIRPGDTTYTGHFIGITNGIIYGMELKMTTNAARQIEYYRTGGTGYLGLYATGYVITEF